MPPSQVTSAEVCLFLLKYQDVCTASYATCTTDNEPNSLECESLYGLPIFPAAAQSYTAYSLQSWHSRLTVNTQAPSIRNHLILETIVNLIGTSHQINS
jgi:hypothetical protein